MFGAGSIQAMITSVKNNRNLLKGRRKNFRDLKDDYAGLHYEHNKLEFKEPTREARCMYKIKLERYKKRGRVIDIAIVAFVFVAIALGLYFMTK